MRTRQAAACLVTLAMCLLGLQLTLTPGASAHAELRGLDPRAGATVATLPTRILMGFTDEMSRPSRIQVVGPDGEPIGLGETIVLGEYVLQEIRDPGLRGTYEVSYEVTSADQHTLRGSYTFSVTSGVAVDGPAGESSADRTWIIAMLVVLAGLALALVLLLRFQRDQS